MASTTNGDETDLSLRATIALTTTIAEQMTSDEPCTAPQADNRRRPHMFCVHGLWSNHKTLLWRLAIFIFLTILITLLETVLPGKTGIITRVLDTMVQGSIGNGTGQ